MRPVLSSLVAAIAVFGVGLAAPAQAAPIALRPAAIDEKLQDKFEEDYGVREIAVLQKMIETSLGGRLEAAGATVSSDAATRIEITLVDVKPSRPTFQQAIDKPGLDIQRSVSNGGATLRARLVGPGDATLQEVTYDWYETDLRNSVGNWTWSDARRAINGFSRQVAKAYKTQAGE